jgi:hypothetical protein
MVGGLVGHNNSGSIENAYSTGLVIGTSDVGGSVGGAHLGTTNDQSYWDTGTSGQANSAGDTSTTTAELRQ